MKYKKLILLSCFVFLALFFISKTSPSSYAQNASCVAGQNGVTCCSDNDCNVAAGAYCKFPGLTTSFCRIDYGTPSSPSCGVTATCGGDAATASASDCVPGTMVTGPYGTTCTSKISNNGVPTTVNVCQGNETTGPCRASRVDQSAASANAAKIGPGCVAVRYNIPGIDVNTGLSYFYDTSCPGDYNYPGSPGYPATSSSGNSGTGGFTNTGTGTNGNSGKTSLNVSSTIEGGNTSTQSASDQAIAAINAQVKQAQEKYINEISQVVNTVGNTVPSCGVNLCPDLQQLIKLQTALYQTGASYVKPIFTTNASGIMHVGDTWNITVTGLNPGETIYATGGKLVNGVVPTDKTPYTANGLGVFSETGTHTKEVIGNWQIVWIRVDGTALGTMTFSVADKASAAILASGTLSLSADSNSYCVYSKGEHLNDTAVYTVQGVTGNMPNQKIVWSSTKNGVSTGESNSYYNQNLNANSFWTGGATPWSLSDIGSWTKTAGIFDGTNIISVSRPFSFTVKDCSGSTVASSTKTNNFAYTFTKIGNAWKITLDNAPLGTPADYFYIPTNYSITALSAYDLNMQAQARFNTGSYFPGTPSGNTFYQNMFGAFIAAFYDWDHQTNTNSSSNSSPTADTLSANGSPSVSVKVGDTVNYAWSSVGGTSYDSYYRADRPDSCVGGFTSADTTKPWVANTASGSTSQMIQPCQAGVTYTIAYRVHNATGTPDSIKSVIVSVQGTASRKVFDPNTTPIESVPCGIMGTCGGGVPPIVPVTPDIPPITPPVTPPVPVVVAPRVTLPTSTDTLASTYSSNVGVYHWGLFSDPSGSVLGGVNFAASKGFKIMRLTLSPRSSFDYGASTTCDSGVPLNKLILLNGFPQALANASINTFILTTYDSTTFSDCTTKKYMNPSFFTTANTATVTQEYYDLAMYLYQTYKNTGKKFIIDNWEGDNDLYCGQGYSYATDVSFRTNCDANYKTTYNGNTSVNDSIIGMKDWLAARTAGIKNAGITAATQGLTGVTVSSAGDMSIVKALHANGFKSMMYDVLPGLNLDYVSYSAYESINNSNPATTLTTDIQTIKSITGNNNIIVGEFGYSADQVGLTNAQNYLKQVAQNISSAGATYGIIWDLFDQPGSNFGLFTTSGATSLFSVLKN